MVGFAHGEKLTISAWLHQASSPLLAWEDTQAPVTPGMPFCSKAEEIPLTIRVQTRAMYQQTPLLPLTSTPPPQTTHSPMLLPNLDLIHVHPVGKPSLPLPNPHIIPTHLPLPHQPPLIIRPVLQPIRPPPLPLLIKPLVPKLHRNLSTPISPPLPNPCNERNIPCYP